MHAVQFHQELTMRNVPATAVFRNPDAAELRRQARNLLEIADRLESGPAPAEPETVTLDVAGKKIGVTPKALRKRIAKGELAGNKDGKAWRVKMADVRALYEPKLRAVPTSRGRKQSVDERLAERLRQAGVGVAS